MLGLQYISLKLSLSKPEPDPVPKLKALARPKIRSPFQLQYTYWSWNGLNRKIPDQIVFHLLALAMRACCWQVNYELDENRLSWHLPALLNSIAFGNRLNQVHLELERA